MSYNEFLNTFTYGINLFINSITNFFSSFISNYFYITLLGIVFFSSLFWFIFNNIVMLRVKKFDVDEKLSHKKNEI